MVRTDDKRACRRRVFSMFMHAVLLRLLPFLSVSIHAPPLPKSLILFIATSFTGTIRSQAGTWRCQWRIVNARQPRALQSVQNIG